MRAFECEHSHEQRTITRPRKIWIIVTTLITSTPGWGQEATGAEMPSWIIGVIVPILTAALGAAATIVAARHRHTQDYKPRKLRPGERKNTVLLIGVGRTGKTELIKSLAEPLGEGRAKVTHKFEITSFSQIDGDNVRFSYDITDYKGQNFTQLISSFIQEQLVPRTRLRYGDVNSLVLMVDLFRFRKSEKPRRTYPELDDRRIQEQISEWNTTALDAVFGLLTEESHGYVCLFINKIDKWACELGDDEKARAAMDAYKPLIDDLKSRRNASQRTPKPTLQIIVGSSMYGRGVLGDGGLLPDLARHSVPAD